LVSGCLPPSKDGPYKGRVIDAETGKPLEGVVVLGVWYKEEMTVGGTVGTYYDARETVTDSKGNFEIQGHGWIFTDTIIRSLSEMHILVFKAEYEHVGGGPWSSFKIDEIFKKTICWEGDRAIIPIRRLTIEERRNRFGSYYFTGVPNEKQRLLIKEIEIDREMIGK